MLFNKGQYFLCLSADTECYVRWHNTIRIDRELRNVLHYKRSGLHALVGRRLDYPGVINGWLSAVAYRHMHVTGKEW